LAYIERALSTEEEARIGRHLEGCAACRALVDEVAGLSLVATGLDARGPAEAPVPLSPGTMVDHFKIIRLAGRGGMGEVYLALDTRLERRVAVKIVHRAALG